MESNVVQETQEGSYRRNHIKRFTEILSCFQPGNDPPIWLFQLSANGQLRWGRNGELQADAAEIQSLVPACVVELFRDIESRDVDNQSRSVRVMIDDGLIVINTRRGQEYVSLRRRDEVLGQLSIEDRMRRSFDIISIFALVYPDEYSSIIWEEVREQLREAVELQCLPFLQVINLGDLLHYLTSCEIRLAGAEIRYLEILSRFLSSITPRYPSLRFLSREILDYMVSSHALSSIQMNFQNMQLPMLCNHGLQQKRDTLESLKDVILNPQDENHNATAGILIGRMLEANLNLKSEIDLETLWKPFNPNRISSFEKIAKAIFSEVLESDESDMEAAQESKAIIGLIYSRRRFFRRAKETLLNILQQGKVQFKPDSWERAIIAAELVKCCNMTQDQGKGEWLARDTLAERHIDVPHTLINLDHARAIPGTQAPAIENRADTQYLLIALADSLMARSKYDEAIAIFHELIEKELPPSLIVKISIRLSKAERRLDETFPSPKITHSLSKGLLRLNEVSTRLQIVYAEELLCNLESQDHEDVQIDQSVQVMKSTLVSALRLQTDQAHGIGQFAHTLNNHLQHIMTRIEQEDSGKGYPYTTSETRFLTELASQGPKGDATKLRHLEILETGQINQDSEIYPVIEQQTRQRITQDGPSVQIDGNTPSSSEVRKGKAKQTVAPNSTVPQSMNSSPANTELDIQYPNQNLAYQLPSFGSRSGPSRIPVISQTHSRRLSYGPQEVLVPPIPPPLATWPVISFLFSINNLPLNEEPSNGGVMPRSDYHGRWLPPLWRAGFGQQTNAALPLYKWQNGIVSPANGYQAYNGEWWGPSRTGAATFYRTSTMFYCQPFDCFLATEGDPSMRDMETSDFPHNQWHTLNFEHHGTLSRLDLFGSERHLAGNGQRFIEQLGLTHWSNPDPGAPVSGGLAGNLALLIALVAFSCRPQHLSDVLQNSWREYSWRGHNHGSGRR